MLTYHVTYELWNQQTMLWEEQSPLTFAGDSDESKEYLYNKGTLMIEAKHPYVPFCVKEIYYPRAGYTYNDDPSPDKGVK